MTQLVTLTTDFGGGSSYVAAMKGALLNIHPQARIIDLTHDIPPQDLLYTSYFLQAAIPYYPTGTLHVVVVDPGVGSQRSILYVELERQRLLVPDNGCWTALAEEAPPRRVIRLTEKDYWRSQVSSTFHGRDIFAPVAGHLGLGVDPRDLGEPVKDWIVLNRPQPQLTETELRGEVVLVDPFGNLLTNIPGAAFRRWQDVPVQVFLGEQEIKSRVQTYSEAPAGTPVVLVSSMDTVEIAINQGNAAQTFHAGVGTPVRVRFPRG